MTTTEHDEARSLREIIAEKDQRIKELNLVLMERLDAYEDIKKTLKTWNIALVDAIKFNDLSKIHKLKLPESITQ